MKTVLSLDKWTRVLSRLGNKSRVPSWKNCGYKHRLDTIRSSSIRNADAYSTNRVMNQKQQAVPWETPSNTATFA